MPLPRNTEEYRQKLYMQICQKAGLPVLPEETEPLCPGGGAEYVLAPFLGAFVLWVLRRCAKEHIRTLYFLARDGWPAYRLARRLGKTLCPELSVRYLACSRYSLRVPLYADNHTEALEYICRGGIAVTPRSMLSRAGLTGEDTAELLQRWACSGGEADRPLSRAGREKWHARLAADERFLTLMDRRSRARWPLLETYLRQEGLTEEGCAIADSGWTGSLQKTLRQALEKIQGAGHTGIQGYYIGLYAQPASEDPDTYACWWFGPGDHLLRKTFFCNNLPEAVFAEDAGTVCGYREEDGRIIPVRARHRICPDKERLQAVFDRYADCLSARCAGAGNFLPDPDRAGRKLEKSLRLLMHRPLPAETAFFGRLPFSDDLLDETLRELAPPFPEAWLSENHLISRMLAGTGRTRRALHEAAWYEGSLARSTDREWRHRCSYTAYRMLSMLRMMAQARLRHHR